MSASITDWHVAALDCAPADVEQQAAAIGQLWRVVRRGEPGGAPSSAPRTT